MMCAMVMNSSTLPARESLISEVYSRVMSGLMSGHNTTWTDFASAMWRARVLCLSTVEHTGLRQMDKLDRWLSVYVLLLTQQQLFIQPGEKLFAELGLEILQ